MKVISFLFFSMFLIEAIAQTNTYNGVFEGGNATYQYYENSTGERIFNGAFKWTWDYEYLDGVQRIRDVSGSFNQDFKNGNWSLVYQPVGYGYIEKITASFDNGLRSGQWRITHTQKSKNTPFKTIKVSYSDGVMTDEIEVTDKDSNTTLKGLFNKKGQREGQWSISTGSDNSYKLTLKYTKGVCYYERLQNLSTGEVISFFDSTSFVSNFFENLAEDSSSTVNNTKYVLTPNRVESTWWGGNRDPLTSQYIDALICDIYIILDDVLGKDGVLRKGEQNLVPVNEFSIIDFSKSSKGIQETLRKNAIERERDELLKKIDNLGLELGDLPSKYKVNQIIREIEYLKKRITEVEYPENIEFFKNRNPLEEIEKTVFEQKIELERKEKIDSLTSAGNKHLNSAKYFRENKPEKSIFIERVVKELESAVLCYESLLNLESNENTKVTLNQIKTELDSTKKLFARLKLEEQVQVLQKTTDNNHETLKTEYSTTSELASLALGTETNKLKKRALFKGYEEIFTHLKNKSNNPEEIQGNLELLIKIQEKMKSLSTNSETKELEKSIKKSNSTEDKISLILNY